MRQAVNCTPGSLRTDGPGLSQPLRSAPVALVSSFLIKWANGQCSVTFVLSVRQFCDLWWLQMQRAQQKSDSKLASEFGKEKPSSEWAKIYEVKAIRKWHQQAILITFKSWGKAKARAKLGSGAKQKHTKGVEQTKHKFTYKCKRGNS